MRVDQVIPSLASRDAIGVHTVNLTRALRAAGIESDVFYGTCTPDMVEVGRPIGALGRQRRQERFLLYQASIGSPVFDTLMTRDEPKLVNYHHITQADQLAPGDPPVAYETSLGRAQLARLASRAVLAVADSHYNELELLEVGYPKTEVVPLLIDMTRAGASPDPSAARRLAADKASGGVDLLFVGKVSPHKAPHDLVKMLSVYRRVYDPAARLRLVGSPLGERYGPALAEFVHDLGLGEAVEITGSVEPSVLEAYYAAADVFVCASEHEGFCVPVVEAMGHDVPVVAYGATAVPETVGDAGLVLPTKSPLRFATAVHRVLTDDALRARLSSAARRQVETFAVGASTARFVELVHAATGA